jgi:hypothetical protein
MAEKIAYAGIHNEPNGAMSRTGNIIRDAWVFELIPETQTCEGWSMGQIDALYDQVSEAWAPYGHLVSNLPPELQERHGRIYSQAIAHAKEVGWDPDKALEGEI